MKYILFFLFISQLLFAQRFSTSISGRVIDDKSKEPLPGVNVYLAETTMGASSNADGYYKFSNIPQGSFIIICSMVGYNYKTERIDILFDNDKIEMNFQLEGKTYKLDSVKVSTDWDSEWHRNKRTFLREFLGKTDRAKECEVKNIEYVDFEWQGDTLVAATNEPLIIENNSLGYSVTCHLKAFYYETINQTSWTHSYLYYKQLPSADTAKISNWKNERANVYSNSLTRFLVSFRDSATVIDNYYISTRSNLSDFLGVIRDLRLIKTNNDKDSSYALHFSNYLIIKDKKNFHTSIIKLLWPRITIDKFGYPKQPRPFVVSGYWRTLGLADQLPKYYHINMD